MAVLAVSRAILAVSTALSARCCTLVPSSGWLACLGLLGVFTACLRLLAIALSIICFRSDCIVLPPFSKEVLMLKFLTHSEQYLCRAGRKSARRFQIAGSSIWPTSGFSGPSLLKMYA